MKIKNCKIKMKNEALRKLKQQAIDAEAQYDQDWAFQQQQASRAMEEAAYEEKSLRRVENEKHLKKFKKIQKI